MAALADKDISAEDIQAKAAEVNGLISKKNFTAALIKALENPPLTSKAPAVKEANRDLVFRVIETIPANDKEIGGFANIPHNSPSTSCTFAEIFLFCFTEWNALLR